jgi:hypothetical protein
MSTSVLSLALGSTHLRRVPVRSLCVAVLVLCLTTAVQQLVTHAVSMAGAREHVYALEADLAHDPAVWLSHPVRTRALLGAQCTVLVGLYAPTCAGWRSALTDPRASTNSGLDSAAQPLPLVWGTQPALPAFLRRLPLVGQLVPRPQIVRSSVPAVYQIQLRPTACVLSAIPLCYEALLLDAFAPDNVTGWVQSGLQ